MAYGFRFYRPSGHILLDANWPTLGFAGKYSGSDPLAKNDPAVSMRNAGRLEAYIAYSSSSSTIYAFESVAGKTATNRSGYNFYRPDSTLIASSSFPPMKVIDFIVVNEDNSGQRVVTVPPGKAYAVLFVSDTTSGYAFDIQHHGAGPPTWEEWWSYSWMNLAIRPVFENGRILFQNQNWPSPGWFESDTPTIQPVDRYLRYECLIVDVTGL